MPRRNHRKRRKRKGPPPMNPKRPDRFMGWYRELSKPGRWKAEEKSVSEAEIQSRQYMQTFYKPGTFSTVVLPFGESPSKGRL
jgi:hypothetical protein